MKLVLRIADCKIRLVPQASWSLSLDTDQLEVTATCMAPNSHEGKWFQSASQEDGWQILQYSAGQVNIKETQII